MIRKLLAFTLVALGIISLLPYVPQTVALFQGQIDMPATDRAQFQLLAPTDTRQLVACSSNAITVKQNGSLPGGIKCWTNFAQDLTVTLTMVDSAGGALASFAPASSYTLSPTQAGASLCRSASVTAGNTAVGPVNAWFKASFQTVDTNFRGEFYFPIAVTVYAGSQGGGGGKGGGGGGGKQQDSWACP